VYATEKALPFPRNQQNFVLFLIGSSVENRKELPMNVWNAKRSIVATEIASQFPSILGICRANSVRCYGKTGSVFPNILGKIFDFSVEGKVTFPTIKK